MDFMEDLYHVCIVQGFFSSCFVFVLFCFVLFFCMFAFCMLLMYYDCAPFVDNRPLICLPIKKKKSCSLLPIIQFLSYGNFLIWACLDPSEEY